MKPKTDSKNQSMMEVREQYTINSVTSKLDFIVRPLTV
jgi:hypothetical protein